MVLFHFDSRIVVKVLFSRFPLKFIVNYEGDEGFSFAKFDLENKKKKRRNKIIKMYIYI